MTPAPASTTAELDRRDPGRATIALVEWEGKAAILKSWPSRSTVFRHVVGRAMARREERAYARLVGLEGVPCLFGRVAPDGIVLERVDGRPVEGPDADLEGRFFDDLSDLLARVRDRGVLHGDVKRNVLVDRSGRPLLVDFGASFVVPRWLRPFLLPLGARYDRRAIVKLKERVAPALLTADDRKLRAQRLPFEGLVALGERVLRTASAWVVR